MMRSGWGASGRRLLAASLGAAVLATACSASAEVAVGDEFENADGYPSWDLDVLSQDLASVLTKYDVTLTRAPLIDRLDDGYERSATGTHLALYVQPPAGTTDAQYITVQRDLTLDMAAVVFEQWPMLVSFDLCQEPPQDVDDRAVPAIYTQVDMTRAAFEALPEDVDLPGLLARSFIGDLGVRLFAAGHLQDHPDYVVAIEEGKRREASGDLDG